MKVTKKYELNMNQFMDVSEVPLPIRMRIALNKLGMKFVDDGRISSAINENPIPFGRCLRYQTVENPDVIVFVQIIEEPDDETI